ncbi:MAG: site-specific integrase, partial [Verrucomicrobiaceae bacterium]
PLISLFNGLRLNEACQLDVADVRLIERIPCFVITAASEGRTTDKRLKTASSARVVPIHPELVALGFMEFVAERKRAGETKLFGEVGLGATGYRSTTFSAWFTRFTGKAKVRSGKTCFHSFRHNFRDALREARIERDIALALGGCPHPVALAHRLPFPTPMEAATKSGRYSRRSVGLATAIWTYRTLVDSPCHELGRPSAMQSEA